MLHLVVNRVKTFKYNLSIVNERVLINQELKNQESYFLNLVQEFIISALLDLLDEGLGFSKASGGNSNGFNPGTPTIF